MKAWVLHGIGDLRYETVEEPVPGTGEGLVRVKAAGICGSDIPRIYCTGAYTHPLVPGHEFSGVVVKTGADAAADWLGKRVGVFPLIPCRICGPCQKRQYEMCRNYSYIGSRRDGAFAEYVSVPAENLIALPERVTFEEAAMLEPMAVAVHAMRRVSIGPADSVVVCGLGTIGLLLVMFLLEAGVEDLLVIGNKESQQKAVQRLGLSPEAYCDSQTQDVSRWIWDHTDGQGAEVLFECVGKKETYALSVDHTAPAGHVVLVGNPSSDMALPKPVYWKILRNQLRVTGTWNSAFLQEAEDDWHYVLDRLSDKKIAPADLITHQLPLSELECGLRIMRDKTEDYVKIMAIDEKMHT